MAADSEIGGQGANPIPALVAVSVVTEHFVPLLKVWLALSGPNLASKPLIAGLDPVADAWLRVCPEVRRAETPSASDPGPDRRHAAVMVDRLAFLSRLLEAGLPFIHTDIDAFWMADPIPILDAEDADVVFSVAGANPPDVVERWGFAVCTGFYLARPTPASRALFRSWAGQAPFETGDQKVLNRLLVGSGIAWSEAAGDPHVSHRGRVVIDGSTLRVSVLRASVIRRAPPYAVSPGPLVVHPFFERRHKASFFGLYSRLVDIGFPVRSQLVDLEAETEVPPRLGPRDRWNWLALNWLAQREALSPVSLLHRADLSRKGGADRLALDDYRAVRDGPQTNRRAVRAGYLACKELGDGFRLRLELDRLVHRAGKLRSRRLTGASRNSDRV